MTPKYNVYKLYTWSFQLPKKLGFVVLSVLGVLFFFAVSCVFLRAFARFLRAFCVFLRSFF